MTAAVEIRSRARARVRAPKSRFQSKLERDWSVVLEAMKRDEQLLRWDYEPERLRLADGTYYTPDFRLVWHDGEVSFDECKGHMREAARVRILVAAELHPYRFRVVRRGKRRSWEIEEIRSVREPRDLIENVGRERAGADDEDV